MSYPLVLVRFQDGEETPVETPVILGVLASYQYVPALLQTPDGGYAELTLHESEDGEGIASCHFSLKDRGLTPQVVECIFAMAKAGVMVIIPEDYSSVILLDPAQEAHLPDPEEMEWEPKVCRTVGELQAMLEE